jgi:meiotically up-regulated gene 157 (Mug157) protein
MNQNGNQNQDYSFQVHEGGRQQTVTYQLKGGLVVTACTCGQSNPCTHILYIAAGKKNKLTSADRASQKELLQQLITTEAGRALTHKAQLSFDHELTCRVCGSERVIDTKKSWLGLFYRLFMPRSLRYHCRKCGWNW